LFRPVCRTRICHCVGCLTDVQGASELGTCCWIGGDGACDVLMSFLTHSLTSSSSLRLKFSTSTLLLHNKLVLSFHFASVQSIIHQPSTARAAYDIHIPPSSFSVLQAGLVSSSLNFNTAFFHWTGSFSTSSIFAPPVYDNKPALFHSLQSRQENLNHYSSGSSKPFNPTLITIFCSASRSCFSTLFRQAQTLYPPLLFLSSEDNKLVLCFTL